MCYWHSNEDSMDALWMKNQMQSMSTTSQDGYHTKDLADFHWRTHISHTKQCKRKTANIATAEEHTSAPSTMIQIG